jgi:GNAT superfamily N-acetyltransferase
VTRRFDVAVVPTTAEHFPGIVALSRAVYPESTGWTTEHLARHRDVFPAGQLVALRTDTGEVVGMAASLIILWDDYDIDTSWRDFTEGGWFTNHDPEHGRTLYGAEVMVDPRHQGYGIGSALYAERFALVRRLQLLRIRAGARLRGYHRMAGHLTPAEYVRGILRGSWSDPTLNFQLARGFTVLGVVTGYLRHDPESLGAAAVIEWVNAEVAEREGYVPAPWSGF